MRDTVNLAAIDKLIAQKTKQYSDEYLGAVLRGIAIEAYFRVLKGTPQWSGHMAANLTISIDGKEAGPVNPPDRAANWRDQDPVYAKGDLQAMDIANTRNSWVNSFTPNKRSKVTIKYVDDENYYNAVESGHGSVYDLRAVNLPQVTLAMAMARVPTNVKFVHVRDGYRIAKI